MKKILLIILLTTSFSCFADDMQMRTMNIDPAKIQQMQNAMQGVRSCMQKIDRNAMEQLKQRSMAMNNEIRSLCNAGKRDEAQQKAIAFGIKIAKSPELQQMKKCTEPLREIMPIPSMIDQYNAYNLKDQNVCDTMK